MEEMKICGLLLTTACLLYGCGPMSEEAAIAELEAEGGRVEGDGTFRRPRILRLPHKLKTDAWLRNLKWFTDIERLSLESDQVTDDGLQHLSVLTNLNWLDLNSTQITDAGLEHLKGLTRLERLDLSNTPVTGQGLVHLKGLTSLKDLDLSNTLITGPGLEQLKEATRILERSNILPANADGHGIFPDGLHLKIRGGARFP